MLSSFWHVLCRISLQLVRPVMLLIAHTTRRKVTYAWMHPDLYWNYSCIISSWSKLLFVFDIYISLIDLLYSFLIFMLIFVIKMSISNRKLHLSEQNNISSEFMIKQTLEIKLLSCSVTLFRIHINKKGCWYHIACPFMFIYWHVCRLMDEVPANPGPIVMLALWKW